MELTDFIQIDYCITVTAAVFFYLKFGIEKTSRLAKKLITIVIAILIGFVWWFSVDIPVTKLITSMFVSVGFYELFLKVILDKFKFKYDDKD